MASPLHRQTRDSLGLWALRSSHLCQDGPAIPYVAPDVTGLHFVETFDADASWPKLLEAGCELLAPAACRGMVKVEAFHCGSLPRPLSFLMLDSSVQAAAMCDVRLRRSTMENSRSPREP